MTRSCCGRVFGHACDIWRVCCVHDVRNKLPETKGKTIAQVTKDFEKY